ncbi:hypothetical protein BC939DRAFT_436897 [Gamsiella multidivaricata]|uniref:uncharacterized protein n=1 Tax=Gamsiella multidivaricata TaxID=101098 RepID=UPI002220E00D|nr:uncharacterized protein BC939DRAFT_436897 [Gamsiella multidivaricata]KAI7831386.1 hypothetical protein BC939DRAFT_436897 [Gamsiella multidivaricata]
MARCVRLTLSCPVLSASFLVIALQLCIRFVALPSGKFKHWRSGKRHINTGMDRGCLNKAGKAAYATPRQSKHLRRLMPYA